MEKRLKPLEQIRKFERVAYAVVSLSIISIGTIGLASGSFGWGSWVGGLVFPPILIVVGVLLLYVVTFHWTAIHKSRKGHKDREA